jgi:aerobic-type carbon monoxide dehydrogenase small subunit (CoxS/CutS family)
MNTQQTRYTNQDGESLSDNLYESLKLNEVDTIDDDGERKVVSVVIDTEAMFAKVQNYIYNAEYGTWEFQPEKIVWYSEQQQSTN